MNSSRFAAVFPIGSHLCREPMPPMPELKADMETLKRHGFNLIKLQEHWAVDEPREGQFDFSRYEELIDYAGRLDLGVYLGLTCEQAPRWLYEQYPDCRMVGADGYPINYVAATTLPSDGKPGPCFDVPDARRLQERFLTNLVTTLGRFENIVVWNTWQEIGYWSERLVGTPVCYCPHTIEHFRRWLRERYGTVDELNRRWHTRFPAWESVFPDTLTTRKNATAQAMEFGYFMHNVQIATVLRERAKTIRRADPLQRPVFAHKAAPEYASASDWTYARCQDFLGTSAYPAWGAAAGGWDDLFPATAGGRYDRHEALLGEIWHGVAVRFDAVRSANPQQAPVWAAEFQGGPVSTGLHKGRVPGAADLRRWMLTALASGVTGISFWVTRAEIMAPETNGFSLLDSTGNTTERFEEAARIGAALNRHPELFAQRTLEPAQVAIVVSEENYRLCGAMTDAAPHLAFSTLGWHRMLWEAGVPVAFVDARSVSGELAESVRLLVLPFPLSISEPLVKQLTDYVAAGGRVVSEACIGRLNEHAFANRGEISPAAADLFGARHRRLVMVREPEDPPRWMPTERTWGEYAEYGLVAGAGVFHGAAVAPALYIQTFEPTSGETVFTWHGEPAGVLHGAACGPEDRPGSGAGGKGGALLLGTLAGHQGMAYRGPENRDLVARILRWTGVQPHPACPAGRLLVRRRFAPEAEAWFFTNPHSGTITEEVDISGFRGVEDLLGGELPRNGNRVSLTVDELDVRVLVLRR